MKILQINTVVNSGSTGRIAEDIGRVLIEKGHESYIAYGRGNRPSASQLIKIGNSVDIYYHVLQTRLFDRHGLASVRATQKLIKQIENIKPDAIGLHNLHGYYINYEILFDYLLKKDVPVLWTLFDCWAFTGHCSYFDDIDCQKYKNQCNRCPKKRNYPASYFMDNSSNNYKIKKALFTSLNRMELVVHSKWLQRMVQSSFLSRLPIHTFPSGIDLNTFIPCNSNLREKYFLGEKKVILGCASPWSERKGLKDFLKVRDLVSEEYVIALIGLNQKQIKALPQGIIGIKNTENVQELAQWYSLADVFVNPTYQDNFPTTNIESLACGTPVITYNTGGSPEAIDEQTGIVVDKGDVDGLRTAIDVVLTNGKNYYREACRARAERFFNKDDRFQDYIELFQKLIG
jgi:glycosyltransferase involved in cell wall biosynthesis